jgi:YHS domain-containing protein
MVSLFTALACFASDAPEPVVALKGFDPVELIAGKEVKGSEEHQTMRHRFKYLFASADNKAKFATDPEAFSVQYDGACVKMGPPGGGGDASRFGVHGGRIYAFASDSCKAAFLKEPERYIDKEDPRPTGSMEQAVRAKALLDKAVAALGDAEALSKCKSVVIEYAYEQDVRGKPFPYESKTTLKFPIGLTKTIAYDGYQGGWTLTESGGRDTLAADAPAVEDSVRRFMTRQYFREPVALLMAWRDGRVKSAYALKKSEVNGKAVEEVVVWIAGAATTLSINPDDGRVLLAAFKDRGPTPGISNQVRTYSDFRRVKGLDLPHAIAFAADGKPIDNPKINVTTVTVD